MSQPSEESDILSHGLQAAALVLRGARQLMERMSTARGLRAVLHQATAGLQLGMPLETIRTGILSSPAVARLSNPNKVADLMLHQAQVTLAGEQDRPRLMPTPTASAGPTPEG